MFFLAVLGSALPADPIPLALDALTGLRTKEVPNSTSIWVLLVDPASKMYRHSFRPSLSNCLAIFLEFLYQRPDMKLED